MEPTPIAPVFLKPVGFLILVDLIVGFVQLAKGLLMSKTIIL
jgi:hypothetical protein